MLASRRREYATRAAEVKAAHAEVAALTELIKAGTAASSRDGSAADGARTADVTQLAPALLAARSGYRMAAAAAEEARGDVAHMQHSVETLTREMEAAFEARRSTERREIRGAGF